MATESQQRLATRHAAGARTERADGEDRRCVPDRLAGRRFRLGSDVAVDIANAEIAMARFATESPGRLGRESLSRLLLRAESLVSCRLDGLRVEPGVLLRAEVSRHLSKQSPDRSVTEVLGTAEALSFALAHLAGGGEITVQLLEGVHRRLTGESGRPGPNGVLQAPPPGATMSGCLQRISPQGAADLMRDLVAFCNDDSLPAVLQAAMAHARFETIEPFSGCNGRIGRILIHLVLSRRGLAPGVALPISSALAPSSLAHVDRFRPTDTANNGFNLRIRHFARSCGQAAADAASLEQRVLGIESTWRRQLGGVRANSSADLLLRRLVDTPVVTVADAAQLTGRSFVHTNEAVAKLVTTGILRQVTEGRRNRVFEAPEIVAALSELVDLD